MAASYSTGVNTSPTDLLQRMVTWLVGQGWTQNMSQADGTGWRAHLSKGGVYLNLRSTPGSESIWQVTLGGGNTTTQIGIGVYLGSGYNGSNAWNAQPGAPIESGTAYNIGCFMQIPAGSSVKYHLLDDGADNIVVVVERTAGLFTHMGWGPSLTKAGAWTGGAYFFAALNASFGGYTAGAGTAAATAYCPFGYAGYGGGGGYGDANGYIDADVDAFTGKWLSNSNNTNATWGYTGKNSASPIFNYYALPAEIPQYGPTFQGRMVSAMNSQANLLPVRLYAARDAGGYSLLGDLPNIFFTNATSNGFSASSIYQLGSDNYIIFPNFAVLKKA